MLRTTKRVALPLFLVLSVSLCVEASPAPAAVNQAITFVIQQGLMSEIKAGDFMPKRFTNPQEFVQVIGKAFGIQPLPLEHETSSITSDHYVLAFQGLGLLKDLHLDRSKPIQRQEAALILYRLLQPSPATTLVDLPLDFKQVSLNMRNAVLFVIGKGWMSLEHEYFNPQKEVTREELAAIAKNVYEFRKNEETKRNWTVYPPLIELKVGEQQRISVISRTKIPYTAVFGWDNPSIGTLTAQGLFTAHVPGHGLITVSAGNHRQQIYVKVVE